MMTNDTSIKETIGHLVRRSPRYGQLAYRLLRDDRIAARQKAPLVGAVGYGISPIDLVPGIIPLLGQLDDLIVLLGALRLTLQQVPATIGNEHLLAVGLTKGDIDADLADSLRASRKIVVTGARGAARAVDRGARFSLKLARSGLRTLRQHDGDLPTAHQP
jgi:uncharacterized membrane protein YkvA (DUF1232 family)